MGLFDNYIEQYGYSPFTPQPQIGDKKYEEDQFGRQHEYTWMVPEGPTGTPPMWIEMGSPFYPKESGGGGGGSTWRPGEYDLTQQEAEMTQRHYYISDALASQQEERLRLNDQRTQAINEGNLALSRQIENRMAANEAQRISLEYQQQAIDAALGQAQVGANVYGTQTQGRSSQLATMADLAKAAAEAQANPWNPLGYLGLVNASGGATPYSNATPETQGVYANQLAQNWQNSFVPALGQINQSIAQTYQTPQYIQDALAKMVPLQATQTPAQRALARYGMSTEGEKAALAAASPEVLKRLWEAGQVR